MVGKQQIFSGRPNLFATNCVVEHSKSCTSCQVEEWHNDYHGAAAYATLPPGRRPGMPGSSLLGKGGSLVRSISPPLLISQLNRFVVFITIAFSHHVTCICHYSTYQVQSVLYAETWRPTSLWSWTLSGTVRPNPWRHVWWKSAHFIVQPGVLDTVLTTD